MKCSPHSRVYLVGTNFCLLIAASHLTRLSLSAGILQPYAQHVSGIVLVDCHCYYSVIKSKHVPVVEAAQFVYNVLDRQHGGLALHPGVVTSDEIRN